MTGDVSWAPTAGDLIVWGVCFAVMAAAVLAAIYLPWRGGD